MNSVITQVKAAFDQISSGVVLETDAIQLSSVIGFAVASGHYVRHDFSFVHIDENGKQHSISLANMVWAHNHAAELPEFAQFVPFKQVERAYITRQKFKGEGKKIVATKHQVKFNAVTNIAA